MFNIYIYIYVQYNIYSIYSIYIIDKQIKNDYKMIIFFTKKLLYFFIIRNLLKTRIIL